MKKCLHSEAWKRQNTKRPKNVTISVMKNKIGKSKHILDVLYVPGLTQNLLSVGQVIRKGYMAKFDGDYCWFKKNVLQ